MLEASVAKVSNPPAEWYSGSELPNELSALRSNSLGMWIIDSWDT